MAIDRATARRPVAHHPKPSTTVPTWMKAVTKLTRAQLQRHELHVDTAKGKAELAKAPASVQAFFKLQQAATADNDGDATVMKLPAGKTTAYAVRWVSEDGSLDRLFVYDHLGKPVAKGWTDEGGAYKWSAAHGAFKLDDTPHGAN
jgi:hypothetical protein